MKKWLATFFWLICSLTTQAALAQTVVNTTAELQSAVQSASGDTTVTLGPSFPTTLSSVITLNIPHAHNIIIDGDQSGSPIELTAGGSFKHFSIGKTASGGSLTFRNIAFKGRRTAADIASDSLGSSGGGIDIGGSANSATYRFENTRFSNIQGRAIVFVDTPVEITNSTFENNAVGAAHGAAISGKGNLTVDNSTFVGNASLWPGYSGGAIGLESYTRTLTVTNSVFLQNRSLTRGGAISLHNSSGAILRVDHSYFGNNQTTVDSNISDGGAISIFGGSSNYATLELTHSTFYKNIAADDGGAVFLENRGSGASATIRNCTMVGNIANDVSPTISSGGAVQLSLNTTATLENNTIVANESKYSGGGLGVHANTGGLPRYYLNNNIIVGNTLTNPSGSNQENVAGKYTFVITLNFVTGSPTDNLGLDNGTATTVTPEKVFGTSAPQLAANQNVLMIGNPNDSTAGHYRTLDTLLILPNDADFPGDTAGMADNTAALASMQVSVDQRGFPRSTTTPDIGAVEIAWVRFNANGGQWSSGVIPPGSNGYHIPGGGASAYDRYYSIAHYDNATVVTPSTPNPPNPGDAFAGWYVDNGNFDTPWNPSDPIAGDTRVIAKWTAPAAAATVWFDGNGADSGSVASMTSTVGSNITLPPNGFTRAGHAFTGWDTDPAGTGTRWQPGDTFPVTQMSRTLYAWWTPVPASTYTVTYTGGGLPGISGLPAPGTGITAGAIYTISSAVPSRGGYTFTGWLSSHNGTIYNTTPASFTMPSENVTLTAQWKSSGGGGAGSAKNIPLTPAAGLLLMVLGITATAGVATRRRKAT